MRWSLRDRFEALARRGPIRLPMLVADVRLHQVVCRRFVLRCVHSAARLSEPLRYPNSSLHLLGIDSRSA
ncbi:hypothetical protein SB717_35390 [Priestia sp. SIMBA_032]|uniref:hypothetical protein n=1 Tax=Priestia sp. SIMBA_032 TaxID=3085775 RepID=UPI00397C8580